MTQIDPRILTGENVPHEWALPPEISERFWGRCWIFTPAELKERDRIIASRWFLVQNERRERCKRCRSVHPYLTVFCIDRPFNGFSELLLLEERINEQHDHEHGEVVHSEEKLILASRPGSILPITERDAVKLAIRIRLKGGSNASYSLPRTG